MADNKSNPKPENKPPKQTPKPDAPSTPLYIEHKSNDQSKRTETATKIRRGD